MQALYVLGHPTLLVLLGERIVVEHCLPLRVSSQVIAERGPAQYPSDMLGVLPEVVNGAAAKIRPRQADRRFAHLERLLLQWSKMRVLFEHSRGALVVLLHPGKLLLAINVREPGIFVRLCAIRSLGPCRPAG